MPARVNNPYAADALRREYTVLGDRINLQVDDVVVPVAIVADLSAGASGIPLVRRAYATFYQAAVAAQYCTFRLEVPPGVVAVVHRILVRNTTSNWGKAHFGSTVTVPANTAEKQYMDGRLREQAGLTPQGVLTFGTQVAILAGPYAHFQISAWPGIATPVEWLIGRDDGQYDFLEFQAPIVNEACGCSIEWDEVPLR